MGWQHKNHDGMRIFKSPNIVFPKGMPKVDSCEKAGK
jgi:hypothetical protein